MALNIKKPRYSNEMDNGVLYSETPMRAPAPRLAARSDISPQSHNVP
jgi:hypothetical protein